MSDQPQTLSSPTPAPVKEPVILHKEKLLSLILIRTDGGTQARAGLNQKVVDDYAELMRDGIEFPKGVVYYDGANYWLSEGFHRYYATQKNGVKGMRVEVRQGTQRDALLNGMSGNIVNGLGLSNADKRHAVETLLNDPQWRVWSNPTIAKLTGTSKTFVYNKRLEKPEWALPIVAGGTGNESPDEIGSQNEGQSETSTTTDSVVQDSNVQESVVQPSASTVPDAEASTTQTPTDAQTADTPTDKATTTPESAAETPAPIVQETKFIQGGKERTRKITTPTLQPVGVVTGSGALVLNRNNTQGAATEGVASDDDVFNDEGDAQTAEARLKINEADLTDAEWLASLPLDSHLAPFVDSHQIFQADALAWRTFFQNGLFTELRKNVGSAVKFAKQTTEVFGPLLEGAQRFTAVKHPKEWKVCVACQGSRMVWVGRVKNDHLEPGTVIPDANNMLTVRAKKIACAQCRGGYEL